MTHDTSEDVANEAARRSLEQRVSALESILLVLPIILIVTLLVLALFLPFVTTEVSDDDETANLFGLIFSLFAPDESGELDRGGALFGGAFTVLVIVIIGAILTVPMLARRPLRGRAAVAPLTFAVLLILGTLGAWVVMGMGTNAEYSPWFTEPALPVLTLATTLTALLVFLPAYRNMWTD